MERNPRKTKAFIITFISVLALLFIAYFLFFRGDGKISQTLSGIQKTFSPLLGTSKPKDINTVTNSSTTSSGGSNSSGSGASSSGGVAGTSSGAGNGGTLGGGTTKNGIKYPTQCSDGIDNDGRNGIDAADRSCHTDGNANNINSYKPESTLEYDFTTLGNGTTSIPQCADGIDNDNQNGADTKDRSCHTDGNANNAKSYNKNIALEYDFKAGGKNLNYTPECSDKIDNDGNKLIDKKDPSCHTDGNANNIKSYNPDGALEYDFSTTGKGTLYKPQCSDGIDNDGKNGADASDLNCHTDGNANNNGQDSTHPNTYDENIALEYDFSSVLKGFNTKTQCSDGLDNDGNGLADTKDPGCWKNRKDPATYDANDSVELDINTQDYVDACTVSLMKAQLVVNQTAIDKLEAAAVLAYNNSFVIKAGTRGIWPKVKKGGGGGAIGTGTGTTTECSDGADNDGNGLKDESDSSCHTDGDKYNTISYDKNISKEFNLPSAGPASVLDCVDGIDNDKSGQTDAQDPGCWTNMNDPKTYDPNDNYEKIEITECNDGVDNDGNGVVDSKDPACWTNAKDPKSYNPSLPYENLVGTFTIPHIAYTKNTVTVVTKNGTLIIPVILLGIYPGNTLPVTDTLINNYLNTMGYDKQAVDSNGNACLINGLAPQCNDGKDNDGDGLVDRSDPGCHIDGDPVLPWDKTKNSEIDGTKVIHPPYVAACKDGVDNDGDGKTDENDPGCHSDLNPNVILSYTPDKTSELNFIPQCRDGKDNDADTLTDEKDPGCHTDLDPNNINTYDPNAYTEFNFIPQCRDGKDNDGNKLIDDKDPGCYTDLKITKKADGTIDTTKYDPNKAIEFKYIAQCSDGVDNDGKNGKDSADLGCFDDKTDPSTYNPEDNFEAEFSGGYVPQCSDGKDNDADTFTDAADPTCHTDGNANNNGQDAAHPNTYDPKYYSESTDNIVNPSPDPTPSIASCVDVPLEFTPEEQRKLDELKRQFAILSPKLKIDADVITENDQKQSYVDLVANVKNLTMQCYDQTNPSKYAGPLDRLSNPYYKSPTQTSFTYASTESSNLDSGTWLGDWNHIYWEIDANKRINSFLHLTKGAPEPNKPRYGLFDIKEIIDRADRQGRTFLIEQDVYNSATGRQSSPNFSQLQNGEYVSNKDMEQDPAFSSKPKLNTIYQIAEAYAHDYTNEYSCSYSGTNSTFTSPDNIDVVYVCPFLKGLTNTIYDETAYVRNGVRVSAAHNGDGHYTTSLQKIEVKVLKRIVDNLVMKVKNGDPSNTSAIYAFPLYDFEQIVKIW